MSRHGNDTAAIIMTPFGHPLAQKMEGPKPGFLEGVKAISEKHGAVLIFDEIRTGFRISLGDAQKTYKEKRKSFYAQLIRMGIFMQPYHHGYIAYRHTEDDLDKAVIAIEEAISCI
jgi:glutamate-1-semialdehyde aminotransferase